jgi:hypothetical protein
MKKYVIIWGGGYRQYTTSKKEALKIAAELLNRYAAVKIEKEH